MGGWVRGGEMLIIVLATLAISTTTVVPRAAPPDSPWQHNHRHRHPLCGHHRRTSPAVPHMWQEEDNWRWHDLPEHRQSLFAPFAPSAATLSVQTRRKDKGGEIEELAAAAIAATDGDGSTGAPSASSASASGCLLLLLRLRGGRKRIPKARSVTRNNQLAIRRVPSMREWRRMREEM